MFSSPRASVLQNKIAEFDLHAAIVSYQIICYDLMLYLLVDLGGEWWERETETAAIKVVIIYCREIHNRDDSVRHFYHFSGVAEKYIIFVYLEDSDLRKSM